MIAIYEGLTDMKCDLCDDESVWMVFNADGKPKLSRLAGISCQEHIGYMVRKERIKEQLEKSIKEPFIESEEMTI